MRIELHLNRPSLIICKQMRPKSGSECFAQGRDLWGEVKARNKKVSDLQSLHKTTSDNLECHMVARIWQKLLYNLEVFCSVINFPDDISSSSPCAFQRSSRLPVTVSQLILFFTSAFSTILHKDLYF